MSALSDSSTKLPIRTAMEARDLDAAVDAFAPRAIIRSPFTDLLAFTGSEQIRAVLEVVLEAFEGLEYTHELHGGEHAVLVARTRVAGRQLEFVDHMRLDEQGKISEFTIFFRPLPASTAAMRVIGAGLGRRSGRARAGVISALARPLGLMSAMGDRLGVKLVRPAL